MPDLEIKVGDRVRFDTHSNMGICEDTVRGFFTKTFLLEPYGRNESAPTIILTNYSWTLVSDVLEVLK